MLEYDDSKIHKKLDYIRTIPISDRKRIIYFKRLLSAGVSPEKVKQRAIKALQKAEKRQKILDYVKMNNSSFYSI